MNISLYTQNSYPSYMPGSMVRSSRSESVQEVNASKPAVSEQMRQLIRGLKQAPAQNRNPHAAMSEDRKNGFLELSGSSETEEKETEKKPVNYNYKDVAAKIQQAKTSVSAGRAVLSAKRKVLELKRKMASGNGDPEELQFALTHAKRMEMAARKKKHHLELEELVVHTQKRDEKLDKMEEAASDMKNALISAEEEKVTEQEDAIFEEREEMFQEVYEEAAESGDEISEEMLSELNEMISRIGEEELKQLEESMEMLESMEIVDPHMSKEDLEKLKRKHRAEENKAIAKADMDYLKSMIKHQQEQAGSIPGMSGSGVSVDSMPIYGNTGEYISAAAMPSDGGVTVDLQI